MAREQFEQPGFRSRPGRPLPDHFDGRVIDGFHRGERGENPVLRTIAAAQTEIRGAV